MVRWNFARGHTLLAFSTFVFSGYSLNLAQGGATCKGPAELERTIEAHPSAGGYDALGAYFGQRQMISCAISAFESAVRLDPNSWETHFNLSLAMLQSNQPKRAATELRIVTRLQPENPLSHIALGVALSQLNQNDAAVAEFRIALNKDPKSVPALDGLAKSLIAQKRYSAAISYLKDAPPVATLQNDLAIAYSKNGNVSEAVQVLTNIVKQDPSSAEAHSNLAVGYTQQDQFRQATEEFKEAHRLAPNDDTIRLSYVKALVVLAEFNTALQLITDYHRRKPHDFEALYLMGVVDPGLGNYAEAETMLRHAVALNGNSYDVRYNLGFTLAKLGKKQEARQQLEKAVQLKPSSSEATFQLAAVLRSLGQEEQAQQELKAFEEKKQTTVKEDVSGTKVNQANEYLQSGHAQQAIDLYRQAIVEDPKNARTRYNLALALDRLGDIAEEREVLQQAIQLDPSLAAAHNQLGFLNLQAGQDTDAEKELKAAIAQDPQYAEAQANLGVLYSQQGENRQAEQLLRQATENNPQYVQAFVNLGLVVAAENNFGVAYRGEGELAPKALDNLRTIYRLLYPDSRVAFETFLKQAEDRGTASLEIPTDASAVTTPRVHQLSSYLGSESCRECHADVYQQWSQTGMARMFRPYAPQNVVGDLKTNNQFYLGGETEYRDGKVQIREAGKKIPFARMAIRDGRHYFDIWQSDGKWHTYPVDYTIGSKFQQAYATRLPNGEIHVFPIQYNLLQKRWINYWKMIDGVASERADPRTWEKLDGATSYQAICAVCHTSQLRNLTRGGFAPNNLEFKEPGIGCEMCHGPSAQHAVEMAVNQFYSKTPLDPPVNFRELGNREFVAICAQCHEQSAIRKPGLAGELNYSSSGNFFGNHVRVPFGEFSRKGFYKDGRFRQTTFMVEALERSQCFQKGQVSCGTCHDPHGHDSVSNPTALKFPDKPDLMCTGCHSQFEDPARAAQHSHHPAESESSRCVSCHMPRIMDALMFRARTHQIDDIPNAEMTRNFGQEESPNACLLCHKQKNAEWVQQTMLAKPASERAKAVTSIPRNGVSSFK